MRLMGLDVGSKTVGISVSDPLGWTAQAVEIIPIDEENEIFGIDRVAEIVKKEQVAGFVIGLPKNMNNTIGPKGELSLEFKSRLENILSIPVYLEDERLTTVTANNVLISGNVSRKNRKKVVDSVAATIILQGYLDRSGKR